MCPKSPLQPTKAYHKIDENYYDLTTFYDLHPGGPDVLKATQNRDITETFRSIHQTMKPEQILKKYRVEPPPEGLIESTGYSTDETGFYSVVRQRVRAALKQKKVTSYKATFVYQSKAVVSLVAYSVLWLYLCFSNRSQPSISHTEVLLCGVAFLIRISLYGYGHEGIHGNIFNSRFANNFFAHFFTEGLALCKTRWVEGHVLQHHPFTGRLDLDPDESLPLIKMNQDCEDANLWLVPAAAVHLTGITTGCINVALQEIIGLIFVVPVNLLERVIMIALHKWQKPEVRGHMKILPSDYSRTSVLDAVGIASWQIFLNLLPFLTCTSWYRALALCLLVSCLSNTTALHAFHANHIAESCHPGKKFVPGADWGMMQVVNTVNFKPLWFLPNTGLENQIEHHLFPTISIAHVDIVKPIIEQTCLDFKLEYKEEHHLFSAIWLHVSYMFSLGYEGVTPAFKLKP